MASDKIFDPIRKQWLDSQPEETVRQKLLLFLLKYKAFPSNLISLELALSSIPGIQTDPSLPKRRLDVVVFMKDPKHEGTLLPLLVIECKDKAFNQKALEQVLGYNHYVKAPYVAVVSQDKICCVFCDSKDKQVILDFIPSYPDLIAAFSNKQKDL